ncbi:DUF5329 domain-containing protein [Pseudomonas sp. HAR-UPW-AIA-41]|uniref:DUF5329 domain-containing protein n=1 Tax=Pseudomonas sp. HAR-UPW-AIA-41 TaxID=1985301 RepID=UPI00159694DB|nr:DUF5329 domain-containing protein [Pseudomonas sp. HAR-UPW-AIA-41]
MPNFTVMWRTIFVSCSLLALSQPSHAALDELGRKEVNSLLDFVEQSGCTFIRNGSEHTSPDARAHLQKKLEYLLDKDLIDSPEQFIKRGASESSFSGEPYRVRCRGMEQLSADWLNAELKRLRSASR